MKKFPYSLYSNSDLPSPMGLIVLAADETLEGEVADAFKDASHPIYATRIPSAPEVSAKSLLDMEDKITDAAALLPASRSYQVVGYGCTSASALMGSARVEERVQRALDVKMVTNPLRATIALTKAQNSPRLALLSPYVEEVNEPLRHALAQSGISTDVFGSFCEAKEANVARICDESLAEAALTLGCQKDVDALFISCTNIRAMHLLPMLSAKLEKPVFSSNSALAWHMRQQYNL